MAGRLSGTASVLTWELRNHLFRPTLPVIWLATTLVAGWSFSWLVTLLAGGGSLVLRQEDDPIFQFLGPNVFLVGTVTLLVPWLTMNLVADERRRGSWEMLLTAATHPGEVIVGKFLAGWLAWMSCFLPWWYYAVVLRTWNGQSRLLGGWFPWPVWQGIPFDMGPVFGAACGMAVLGAFWLAIGLLWSAFCRTPLIAGLLSLTSMLFLLALSIVPDLLGYWNISGEYLRLANSMACWKHYEQFSQGLISPRLVVGYLTLTIGFLWLATGIARWKDNLAT